LLYFFFYAVFMTINLVVFCKANGDSKKSNNNNRSRAPPQYRGTYGYYTHDGQYIVAAPANQESSQFTPTPEKRQEDQQQRKTQEDQQARSSRLTKFIILYVFTILCIIITCTVGIIWQVTIIDIYEWAAVTGMCICYVLIGLNGALQ